MRKLVMLSASMAFALLLALFLPDRLPLILALVGFAFFILLHAFQPGTRRTRALWISFGCFLGFLWFSLYSVFFYLPAGQLYDRTIRLEAVVTQFPTDTDYGIAVPIRGGEADGHAVSMRLYMDKTFKLLRPGDRISTIAHCRSTKTAEGRENLSLRAKGLYLFAKSYGAVQVSSPTHISPRYYPNFLAQWMRDSISTLYDEDTAPLFFAILTGWQSELSAESRSDFSRTGLAHVVAVSGMHISFLAGALSLLLRKPGRKSATVQILVIFFFAAMTGSSAGALRAAFLCSAALLAPLFGRRSDSVTSLFTALFFLLLANPFSIAGAGLQFSFSATLGIYLLGQPLYRDWLGRLPKKGAHLLAFPCSILAISLGAMLFTTPLTALYFGQVSLIAPLANLLTNVLISSSFFASIISLCVYAIFPPLAVLLAGLTAVPARLFLLCSHSLAHFPFAAVTLSCVYYQLFFVFLYAIVLLSLYWWWRGVRRPLIPLCACLCTFFVSALLTNLTLSTRPLVLSVLDVGQGQSILVSSGKQRALIDCGGTRDAGAIAANHLNSYGWISLDLLVLTHYHADHTNGLAELFERVAVRRIALPDTDHGSPERQAVEALAAQHGAALCYISEETSIRLGKAQLQLFPPLSLIGDNEAGLSLLCQYQSWEALITGDMGSETEVRLLNTYPLPALELLVLGHHGSRYATSDALLSTTTPERAIASVGKNTYGHPAPETLARLSAAGTTLYRSDQMGTVTVFAAESED